MRKYQSQRSTDEGAADVAKGGGDVAQSKKKKIQKHMWPIHIFVGP